MRAVVILGAAAVVAGCLFPSFDDFRGTGTAGGSSSGDGTSTSSSSSGGSSSSSGAAKDGGVDAGPDPNGPGVLCGTEMCDSNFGCCTTIGGPTCEDRGTITTCGIQGGDAFLCDGNEDCNTGEVCCVIDGDAECKPTCSGVTLCNAPKSTCPAGKSCTGKHDIFKACQ